MERHGLPYARAGQRIGLLGGSFDPPHEGHAHITRTALHRFGLDRVWWLVSPGNPLKSEGPRPIAERLAASRRVMDDPRVAITDIEARLGTRHTARTLSEMQRLYPGVRFTWLMGADNLGQFHHWQDWRQIMMQVRVGVLARPGQRISARRSKAAQVFADQRLAARASVLLGSAEAPCWCFINLPMTDASSTAIRNRGEW